MNIFPNPFAQSATVELEGLIGGEINFQLYDVLGQLVYKKTSFDTQFKIEPTALPKGVYFFNLYNKNRIIGKGKVVLK